MSQVRTWRKLSKGIYADRYSIRAVVNIAAGRQEKRFDLDTPLADIKKWRNQARVHLETLYPQKRAGMRGHRTFSAAVKAYLKTLAIASWQSRRSELRAWEACFGEKRRARVTQDDVRAAVKAWSEAGVPPKTILNRVRALTAMYHTLDGPDAWTPAKHVTLPTVVKKRPAYVSVEVFRRVERNLRAGDPQTHARFMVLAASGLRPAHVQRTQPGDVDLERRSWTVTAVKGGEPIELWLNTDLLAAWRAFIAAHAWGAFNSTDYAKALRAAGWPEHVRPYAAKHSLSQDLGDLGVDLATIADWQGHTDTQTTRIYTGVIRKKLRAAAEAIDGRLGWGDSLADTVGSAPDIRAKTLTNKTLAGT